MPTFLKDFRGLAIGYVARMRTDAVKRREKYPGCIFRALRIIIRAKNTDHGCPDVMSGISSPLYGGEGVILDGMIKRSTFIGVELLEGSWQRSMESSMSV